MGHRVRVITGKGPVSLPNKTVLKDGQETVLTDAQFATLGAAVGTLLTDVGSELAPGEGGGGGGDTSALTSAVTDLQVALGLKQDASTAATDAEVATIQGALATLISANTTALGLKQDASTAATDTELGAETSRAQAAEALAQPASTAATDAELASGLALKAPLVSLWAATTAYKAGQLVVNAGQVYTAKADFTSGATFDVTNWNYAAPGLIDSAEMLADATVTTNATWQVIPGGLLIAPPSTNRDVILELSGVAVSHTSTQASASFHLGIWDVTAAAVKAARTIDYPTAARWATCPTVRYRLPAGSAAHSYQAAVFAGTTGTFTARTSTGLGWLFTAIQV